MPVSPSVSAHGKKFGYHWTDFYENLILEYFFENLILEDFFENLILEDFFENLSRNFKFY
jgi:hypothetical protein